MTSSSSTSVLLFFALVGFGVVIVMPFIETILEPAWWRWPVVILLEIAAFVGSAMVWSAVSSQFRESMQKCSRCGGGIEITGYGLKHSFLPSIDDVAIGFLYVAVQTGIVMAILWSGRTS